MSSAPKTLARRARSADLAQDETDALLLSALDTLGGGVLVADDALRIAGATPAAARILGAPVPPGAHLVKILCGHTGCPSLVEALAAGRAAVTTIPLSAGRAARVRCTPLRHRA